MAPKMEQRTQIVFPELSFHDYHFKLNAEAPGEKTPNRYEVLWSCFRVYLCPSCINHSQSNVHVVHASRFPFDAFKLLCNMNSLKHGCI